MIDRFFKSKTKWVAYALALVAVDRWMEWGLVSDELVQAVVVGLFAAAVWALRDAIKEPASSRHLEFVRKRPYDPTIGQQEERVREALQKVD